MKSTEAKINHLVTSEEIAGLVKKIMNLEDDEGKEMRKRATEFQQIWQGAIAEGGSSKMNVKAFVKGISQDHTRGLSNLNLLVGSSDKIV